MLLIRASVPTLVSLCSKYPPRVRIKQSREEAEIMPKNVAKINQTSV